MLTVKSLKAVNPNRLRTYQDQYLRNLKLRMPKAVNANRLRTCQDQYLRNVKLRMPNVQLRATLDLCHHRAHQACRGPLTGHAGMPTRWFLTQNACRACVSSSNKGCDSKFTIVLLVWEPALSPSSKL